jgi:hypothetical protein
MLTRSRPLHKTVPSKFFDRVSVRVQLTALYSKVDSTRARKSFILTVLETEVLFQTLTNRVQASQANAFLISKSLVQLSSLERFSTSFAVHCIFNN